MTGANGHRPDLAPIVGGRRRVFACHQATCSPHALPNSLAAVRECVQAGVPRIEVDVRFLADGGMVILHDATLDRETTATGSVVDLTTAEARKLRHRDAPGTAVCLLDDVVEALRGSSTRLQVDLKLMRPITESQAAALVSVLRPLDDHLLIGSMAHWNLRPFVDAGLPVALDPTLQWHYAPGRPAEALHPVTLGVHGLWDDAPIAHSRHATAEDYVDIRIQDLVGLLPEAVEWMMDIATIRYLGGLGIAIGDRLLEHGVELAAWTVARVDADTPALLHELFGLGVTTVITDDAVGLAAIVAAR